MIVHASDPVDVNHKNPHDCGCGCGGKCGCENRCCDLQCLVRPNFFCGQLLTDTDLGAMVDWARTRFGLSRYRHGWGVVCGLEVTCTSPRGGDDCCSDGRGGPTIWVNPGYAIDCCGNDLVVCDPIPVDLSGVCRPADDPCAPPPKVPTKTRVPQDDTGDQDLTCWDLLGRGRVTIELNLRYDETFSHGQRAMLRGACGDTAACEPTRITERPCVEARLVDVDADTGEDESNVWEKKFREELAEAMRRIENALKGGIESLLTYIRRHPPYRFCFIEELACCQFGDADKGKKGELKVDRVDLQRIGYWMLLDWLLHALECNCWSCRPDPGVPIGRVLLRRADPLGRAACRVMLIDSGAPYRRPLHKDDCRPMKRGAIDLGRYLWQSEAAVAQQLRAQGVTVKKGEAHGEIELWRLARETKLSLDADEVLGSAVQPLLVQDPFASARVAGFRVTDKT